MRFDDKYDFNEYYQGDKIKFDYLIKYGRSSNNKCTIFIEDGWNYKGSLASFFILLKMY